VNDYAILVNEIDTLLQGRELSPAQRAALLDTVRRRLEVPATIWSPDDFRDFLTNPTQELLEEVWESFIPPVTQGQWDQVEFHARRYQAQRVDPAPLITDRDSVIKRAKDVEEGDLLPSGFVKTIERSGDRVIFHFSGGNTEWAARDGQVQVLGRYEGIM